MNPNPRTKKGCGRGFAEGGAATELALVGGRVLTDRGLVEASVLLEGEKIRRIVPVGDGERFPGYGSLDCSGLVVAPGFIDAHAHDDVAVTVPECVEAKIRQGVTTTTVGMDGLGYAPLSSSVSDAVVRYWRPVNGDPGSRVYQTMAEARLGYRGKLGLNVILHAPHANFRLAETGFARAALTADPLARAAGAVADALAEGALGLTTGLSYVPAVFSNPEELAALARPLVSHHLPYISHLRTYGLGIFEAVDEAVRLGEELGIPIHLSHLHLCHPDLFGRGGAMLEHLDRARQRGVEITWDLYPYTAGSSILHSYLPVWLTEGGPEQLDRRLEDPGVIPRLASDGQFSAFDWQMVTIAGTTSGAHVGQTVADVAREVGIGPAEAVIRLLREEQLSVSCVVEQTLEDDDDLFLAADPAVVGSDGLMFGQRPHPRGYGAFAAFFARFVREKRRISLEAAVRKMSTQTAALYGLSDRGRIAPGFKADLTVFDPAAFGPRATYDAPRRPAVGVRHVMVNGHPVLRDGVFHPEELPGEVVRR